MTTKRLPTPQEALAKQAVETDRALRRKRAEQKASRRLLLACLRGLLGEGGGPWVIPAHMLGLGDLRRCTYAEICEELPDVIRELQESGWVVTEEAWVELDHENRAVERYARFPFVRPALPAAEVEQCSRYVLREFDGGDWRRQWWLGETEGSVEWIRIAQYGYEYCVFGPPGARISERMVPTFGEAVGQLIDILPRANGRMSIEVPIEVGDTGLALAPDVEPESWTIEYSDQYNFGGAALYRSLCGSIERTLEERKARGATKWSGIKSAVIEFDRDCTRLVVSAGTAL